MAEKSLQEFEASLDRSISYTGKSSCQLRSLSAIATAGVMRQTLTSNAYHSQRIRLSGFLKTELTDGWAGLWMRIEGENGARLSLDNMQTRPVKGMTDWRKYEVVLDVPADSLAVSFGFFLAGKGRIWADDFALEAVGNEVSVTEVYGKKKQATEQPEQTKRQEAYARRLKEELKTKPTKPMNMNFEEPE